MIEKDIRLCACGCGMELMGNDPSRIYRRGHSPKPHKNKCATIDCDNYADGRSKYCKECLIKLKPKPRLCACGCGGIVTSRLREVRFLPGHNATTEECKNKARKTCNERYGGNGPMSSRLIQEKSKETCTKRYGVDNVFKCETIKTKIKDYYTNNYGVSNPSQVNSIHKRQTESIVKIKRINTYKKLHEEYHNVQLISPFEDFLNYEDSKLELLEWKCKTCGNIFKSRRDGNYVGGECRCFICNPRVTSKYQNQIFDFLNSLNIIVTQNRRDIIKPKELDIYLPYNRIAIEFNGLFWHSHQQMLNETYHKDKTEKCDELNIQLIQIFEDEWLNKKDIIQSFLKQLVDLYDKVIPIDECSIKTNISKEDSRKFLEENHILGYCNSTYNYGLYYKDELVSIMTFENLKKVTNDYKLLRFCNKNGFCIRNSESLLFDCFVNDKQPNKIISYIDRRWYNGKILESLKFKFIKNTDCNFFYVINDHRDNNLLWKKTLLPSKLKIFDETKTEYENMLINGYDKIYDCGDKLYQWVRSEHINNN